MGGPANMRVMLQCLTYLLPIWAIISLTNKHSCPSPPPHLSSSHQGLDRVVSSMPVEKLQEGMAASRAAGMDPASLFQRMMSNPRLAKHLQNPRVFAALMEITGDPSAMHKFKDDQDVLQVMKLLEIVNHTP